MKALRTTACAACAVLVLAVVGCRREPPPPAPPPPWEIVAENRGSVACYIAVVLSDGRSVRVDSLEVGKVHMFLSGTEPAQVREVQFQPAKGNSAFVRMVEPPPELVPGKRYRLVVGADDKLTETLENQ